MGDSKEHGQPDRRGMEQRHYSRFSMGVPLGGSDVRGRNDHSLATHQLEETLPAVVHRHAVMAHDDRGMRGLSRDLSVRDSRYATIYLFPILV